MPNINKTGFSGTSYDEWYIGDSTNASDKIIYANNTTAAIKPAIRYNSVTFTWEFSNDGAIWQGIGPNIHNDLFGLQGGNGPGEYYHISFDAYNWVTGYLHNGLNGLQGGAPNEYYHLSLDAYTWVNDAYVLGNPGDVLTVNNVGSAPTWSDNFMTVVSVGKAGIITPNCDGYFLQDLTESSDETFPAFVVNTDLSCLITDLSATMSDPMAGGESLVITVRVDEMDSPLTVTLNAATPLSGGGTLYREINTTSPFYINDGDKITVRFLSSLSCDAKNVMVNFVIMKKAP